MYTDTRMHTLTKYCSFILLLKVLGVLSNPTCSNWCPPSVGYGQCCDYPGQGYYPGYPALVGPAISGPTMIGPIVSGPVGSGQAGSCPVIPGCTLVPTLYCPLLNCNTPPTNLKECSEDNECIRTEKCCKNPCDEGKTVCLTGTKKQDIPTECPIIENCRKWNEDNPNPVTCTSTDDCKRSDSCCSTPCNIVKVCQKTETPPPSKYQCIFGLTRCT